MRSWFEKVILLLVCFCLTCVAAYAQKAPALGALFEFNAVASSKVTNSGNTIVNASVGAAGGPVSGFPPGVCRREIHNQTPLATQAIADARLAYEFLASQANTGSLPSPGNLSGITITPGVYTINSNAQLNGTLTLDGQNQENPIFIIRVTGNLNVVKAFYDLENNAAGINLFWVVDNEVKIHRGASALGNIFSKNNISMEEGAQLQGRLISVSGEVNLANNILNHPADLQILLDKSPGSKGVNTYAFGESITYTIKVRNNGPTNEDGVTVSNIKYNGELQSYTSSVAGATFDGATWSIGTLNYKQEATLTIKARINQAGLSELHALVYGVGIDEILQNNVGDLNFCVLLSETGEISGPTEVCANSTFVYSIAPVDGATRYAWSVPSGWSFVQLGPTSIRVTAGETTGQIKVTASNTCGEGPPRTLEVRPVLEAPQKPGPITGPQDLCSGSTPSTVTYSIAPVANASTYTWALPEGWTMVSGQGTTEVTVTPGSKGGSISVVATNACGDSAPSVLNVIISDSTPTAPANIIGTTQGCVGTTVTYEVNPIAGITKYNWGVPAGWDILSGQGSPKISVRVGSSAGEVTVQVENGCGVSPVVSLPVSPVTEPSPAPGPITGPEVSCLNQTGLVYSIVAIPTATSYVWSVPTGWTITSGQGTTSITVNATDKGGVVSVVAVNDCGNSPSGNLSVTVTEDVPPTPGPITGPELSCATTTATYSIAEVENAVGYNWTVPGGWKIISGQGTTTIEVEVGTAAGQVSVTATNGCGNGGTQQLNVTPVATAPVAPKAILGNPVACANGEATFSVDPVAGASSYTWSVPADWAITSGQGTPMVKVLVGTTPGTISVTTANDCGQGGTISREIILNTQPPAAPGPVTGTQQVCASTTVTYSIAAVADANTYNWAVPNGWVITSGQGTTTIQVQVGSAAGNVSVTATNACGTSAASTLAVVPATDTPITIGSIKAPAGSFCENTAGLEYSIDPVSNAVGYTWEVPAGWSITAGQGTNRITVKAGAASGQVRVTVVNACGSAATATVGVQPRTLPLVPEISVGPARPCVGTSTTYSVTASSNIDSYTWAVPAGWVIVSGQGTATIEVMPTAAGGKVSVVATNSCGGSGEAEVVVSPSADAPVQPGIITGPTGVCVGQIVNYSISNGNNSATYTWSVPTGWEVIDGQGTGAITVRAGTEAGNITVVGANGCGESESTVLAVGAMPAEGATEIKDTSNPCQGLSYEVEPVPGATDYTWSVPAGWSILSGQGTPKITVSPGTGKGDISLVVSNGGCTDAPLYITPNAELAYGDLRFPNVFSPNGDGTHDLWEISNLKNYPDNEVTVINRWGNEVFSRKSYQNDWDGSNLSEGTYYYLVRVKLCDGEDKVFKGYVMIVR